MDEEITQSNRIEFDDQNKGNKSVKTTSSNIPSELATYLDGDLNPVKQVQQFSNLIRNASKFNTSQSQNQNRNSNVNIRPINKNKHSKKTLNNSIMFEKFEESKMEESKMEESMMFFDFED